MEMVLGDIRAFGYRIRARKAICYKTPPLKSLPQEYYVIEHGNGDETKYQFTMTRANN